MTDRYERIRKALAKGPTHGPWGATHGDAYLIASCDPDTIRALLVAAGEVRQPSRIERLLEAANGHEDKSQTHAARRVLAKRGIDWRTER